MDEDREGVCLCEAATVLPLTSPRLDPAIIHVVLLPGVVDEFPIIASIFLDNIETFKTLKHRNRKTPAAVIFSVWMP